MQTTVGEYESLARASPSPVTRVSRRQGGGGLFQFSGIDFLPHGEWSEFIPLSSNCVRGALRHPMAFGNLEAGVRSCQEKSKGRTAGSDEWETTGLICKELPPWGPCRRNLVWSFKKVSCPSEVLEGRERG